MGAVPADCLTVYRLTVYRLTTRAAYAHRLFCGRHLGTDEAVGAFPVGRRLAHDAAKGGLWVVCAACGRRNLTPLEGRWEAIEEAERLFRGTRLRASTDTVGLARVRDGTDLVRVGTPLRPEFAAWRYGRRFLGRRRRALVRQAVVGPPAVGLAVAGVAAPYVVAAAVPAAAGLAGMLIAGYLASRVVDFAATHIDRGISLATRTNGDRVIAWVSDPGTGATAPVRLADLPRVQLGRAPDGSLAVVTTEAGGARAYAGWEAQRLLERLTPHLNEYGAAQADVGDAVRAIDVRGGPARYLESLSWVAARAGSARRPSERGASDLGANGGGIALGELSEVQCLALEMALHEEHERRALGGELAALERSWRDAEEVAAIADALLIPDRVQRSFARPVGGRGERAG